MAKSLLASQLIYLFRALDPPKGVIAEANSILYKFIWKTVERVKRVVINKPHDQGGLKMVNLAHMSMSMHIQWIEKIMKGDTTALILPQCILSNVGEDYAIFKFNTSFRNIARHINLSELPVFLSKRDM